MHLEAFKQDCYTWLLSDAARQDVRRAPPDGVGLEAHCSFLFVPHIINKVHSKVFSKEYANISELGQKSIVNRLRMNVKF